MHSRWFQDQGSDKPQNPSGNGYLFKDQRSASFGRSRYFRKQRSAERFSRRWDSINATDRTLSDLSLRGQWRDFLQRRSSFNPFLLTLSFSICSNRDATSRFKRPAILLHAIGQSSFLCHRRSSFEELFSTDNFSLDSSSFILGVSQCLQRCFPEISRKLPRDIWPGWMSCKIVRTTLTVIHCRNRLSTITFNVSDTRFRRNSDVIWPRESNKTIFYFSHESDVIVRRANLASIISMSVKDSRCYDRCFPKYRSCRGF